MTTDSSNRKLPTSQIFHAVLQGAGAGLVLAAAFAAGFFFRDYSDAARPSDTSYSILNEIEGVLTHYYYYEMPVPEDLVYGAARGLVAELGNPYTYFVEPETAEINEDNLAGSFGGIGAEIVRNEAGQFVIYRVYRDSPACKAGVQEGDIIAAVDGIPVDPNTPDSTELLSAIRGEIGDPVVLTLQRGAETLEIEIVRDEVLFPSTYWQIVDSDSRLGYIQISRFTTRTPEELETALEELASSGVRALILDLRNNGGGLVDSALAVISEFQDGGVTLIEDRKEQGEQVFEASRGGTATDIPLIVMVNHSTASASEIVAGALQDHGRAVLLGEQTFGKGSVQIIHTLSDSSSLHVTTAEWYTPNRRRIEGAGLHPDIEVMTEEGGDQQFERAVEYLQDILVENEATQNEN
nr:S41 family peptidase [Anaerolineae bacterium]